MLGRVPPNLKFLVDDLTSDWEYESNPFDFIHARYLCFSFKDIGKLVKQCYRYIIRAIFLFPFLDPLTTNRSVKPGGWVEFQDWDAYPISQDGSLSGTDLEKYYNEVYGAFEKTGVEVRPGIKLEQWFKDAGFVNIQVEKFVIPYGVWPKDARLVSSPLLILRVSNHSSVLTSWNRRKWAHGPRSRQKRVVMSQ